MFGNSKPVPFNPYGARRARRGVPPWLALLVIGMALGVGAVLVVQDRYLPPRLSADESIKLRQAYASADAERNHLKAALADSTARLQTAVSERKTAVDDLAAGVAGNQHLRDDLGALIAALPPDPRGGTVQVRAGRFAVQAGALSYDLVLTRDKAGAHPLPVVLQFTVAGNAAGGAEKSVTLKPVPLSIDAQDIARGSLELPEGFKPRQTTITVLDRPGGKALGMRVMLLNQAPASQPRAGENR